MDVIALLIVILTLNAFSVTESRATSANAGKASSVMEKFATCSIKV